MSNIVVSPHYLSTNAGIEILQNGGNAIDAAIGTNIVQGVVAPETCGIGGDLFSLIWINGENLSRGLGDVYKRQMHTKPAFNSSWNSYRHWVI